MSCIGIKEFIESYNNKKTAKVYKSIFRLYIKYVTGDKKGEKINELSIKYIEKIRREEAIQDLKDYIDYMNNENITPLTIKNRYSLICLWLEVNDIKISKWEMRKIKQNAPLPRVQTMEQELSKDKLYEIYKNLNLREQTMFLIMAGSGTRISETAQIQVEDLELENNIINLRRNYTKNKSDRIIIITDEAREKIEELIRFKKIESGRIFETTTANFYAAWSRAIRKTEYTRKNKSTKAVRYMIHPHMLRKWFLSQFKLYASREIAELLAGHTGYLTDSYRRYSIDEIKREFEKAEKALSITKNNSVTIEMDFKNSSYYGVCYEC